MRIIITAIGRLKKGPERELVARYVDRTQRTGKSIGVTAVEMTEIAESRAQTTELRRQNEAEMLLERLPESSHIIVFDERGRSPDSRTFAQSIQQQSNAGTGSLVFIIGGPDGLAQSLRKRADQIISFGSLTMPHQLVRIMVCEQIYRATTILTNHPYHRD